MRTSYRIDINDRSMYPMGATVIEGGMHVSFVSKGTECALLLYKKGSKARKERILFPQESRIGNVWSMTVLGDFENMEYTFEEDGKEVPDPYGRQFSGRERWGSEDHLKHTLRAVCGEEPFDWEGDKPLMIPYQDSILYRIHPRGFTKHASSGVEGKDRGTFRAVAEKIPYMKELGVTTVEMMPPVEFEEVILPDHMDGSPFAEEEPTGKLNYWGYTRGLLFAPKAAYCAGQEKDPRKEFKQLVKTLHKEGLELVMELYFDGTEAPSHALDAVRFWVQEYHVDGIHLVGYAPLKLLAEDPYLSRTKLFACNWENVDFGNCRHLAEYNQGFMTDMRSFLKGDEGQLNNLVKRTRRSPKTMGTINYIANTDCFTMEDMVSYDVKHNEENGEANRDGTDHNQSWNCGVEGPTRKKKVLAMRRKQLKNAMLLLFLSQGTPLIMAGDEFGRTKKGNNNSYCQDNEISWINWGLLKANRDLCEFTKYVIAFRKAHPVFHMEEEPALLDYRSVGLPDVSYHGIKAWCPEFESFRRQLGIFYCGKYGKKADGTEDDYFYVAYNMHWEPHEFALPHLPKELKWHLAFDTDDEAAGGFYRPGTEPLLSDQKQQLIMARSIVVFIGKKAEAPEDDTDRKSGETEEKEE